MSSLEYEQNQVDAYVDHLAEVNKANQVVATSDLYNEQGVLLAKQGTSISSKMAEKLIRHKLRKPLEQSVALEHSLSGEQLLADIDKQWSAAADLQCLSRHVTEASLREARDRVMRLPMLVQKLTVLRERLPDQYDKALYCAWFGLAIATRLQRPDAKPVEVFIAGLAHDIGMLHIDPAIVNKSGELSPEEWRAIQSHVVIGKVCLESMSSVPRAVAVAVLEHHERCDGSGYPSARFADELSLMGQIVAITDMLYAIRFSADPKRNSDLQLLLPVLQVNDYSFAAEVYEATRFLIKTAGIRSPRLYSEDAELLQRLPKLLVLAQTLKRYEASVVHLNQHLPVDQMNRRQLRSLAATGLALENLLIRSGMTSEGLIRWVSHVHQAKLQPAYAEMEEVDLMFDELLWRFRDLRRLLHLVQKDAPESLRPLLAAIERSFNDAAKERQSVIA